VCDIVIQLISEYKFDVNCKDDANQTPVHLASRFGHLDVVKYLSNTGECDLTIKTDSGETPLDRARRRGYHEIVEFISEVLATSTLTCK